MIGEFFKPILDMLNLIALRKIGNKLEKITDKEHNKLMQEQYRMTHPINEKELEERGLK